MLQNDSIHFLRDLKENNHKSWFDVNRKRYEALKKDYHGLVENILTPMKSLDESLDMLQVKDCVFRINRDIRFSKDKSPYKTYLGVNLAPYGKKMQLAGYYMHFDEGQSFCGGGVYMPMAPELKKVRSEIHYCFEEFKSIIDNPVFVNTFGGLDVNPSITLSRPPKDYTSDDPAIDWLKLKSFTAVRSFEDDLFSSDQLSPTVLKTFTAIKPLIRFINRALLSDENGNRIIP